MSTEESVGEENRKHYANQMYELKMRLVELVKLTTPEPKGAPTLQARIHFEGACLQLRKVLELIAFSSLAANQKFCAEKNLKFAEFWHAKRFTRILADLNPHFFPQPFNRMPSAPNRHHFDEDRSGEALTITQFNELFDDVSSLLHVGNPYGQTEAVSLKRSFAEWIARIKRLLNIHVVRLVDGDMVLVDMLDWQQGNVVVVLASKMP